jgi:hypothetical protein
VQKLKHTASRLGYSDNEEGHGLINADEAMKAL